MPDPNATGAAPAVTNMGERPTAAPVADGLAPGLPDTGLSLTARSQGGVGVVLLLLGGLFLLEAVRNRRR